MRESTVEKFLTAQVIRRGGWCVKLAPTRAGLPDRMVLLPAGRMYLVELKQPKGAVSRIQEIVHAELKYRGFIVETLWSREHVREFLIKVDAERNEQYEVEQQ